MKYLLAVIGFLFIGVNIVDSVKVTIFYESLCPDSVRFIVNQLYPTYYNVASVIEVDFVPYGKANHTYINGSWQFTCQHGEEECIGNKYQACALAQNQTQATNVEFITCVMNSTNPAVAQTISNCALFTNISFEQINECFSGNESDIILAELGERTHAIPNTQIFVPTITFNDIFLQDLQDRSLTDFPGAICSQLNANQLEGYCRSNEDEHQSVANTFIVNGILIVVAFLVVVN